MEPYTITERLVDWGFGAPSGLISKSGPDDTYRGWFQGTAIGFDSSMRDGDGHLARGIFGLDMVQRPDLIIGVAGGWEDGGSGAFDDQISADLQGYFVGPFVAWKPDPNLLLDLWAGYAHDDIDSNVVGLLGSYDVDRFFVSANATGRLFWGETEIRPKLELFYSNNDTASHTYIPSAGTGLPDNLRLNVQGGHDDLFISTLSAELRREYRLSSGALIAPYARIGIDLMLARPNDGDILDEDLRFVSTESVTGNILGGMTVTFQNGARLDARVGYGGIGQNGLDVYGGEAAFTIPF